MARSSTVERANLSRRVTTKISFLRTFAQKLFKLGTIALGSGDFLLEQFLTPDGQEARPLEIEGLVLGGDAGVAELHAATSCLLQKYPRKFFISRWLFAKDSALILRRALLLRKSMEFREKWRSRF
jgi:hypothetical protein